MRRVSAATLRAIRRWLTGASSTRQRAACRWQTADAARVAQPAAVTHRPAGPVHRLDATALAGTGRHSTGCPCAGPGADRARLAQFASAASRRRAGRAPPTYRVPLRSLPSNFGTAAGWERSRPGTSYRQGPSHLCGSQAVSRRGDRRRRVGLRRAGSVPRKDAPSVSEPLPPSGRNHAPAAEHPASMVDPHQLFSVDADLHDLIAQTIRPRHFREFRRAKAVRRFIRRYDAAFAAAGLSVDQRARLLVLGAAIVREAETDDWVCLSEHATDVTSNAAVVRVRDPDHRRPRRPSRPWPADPRPAPGPAPPLARDAPWRAAGRSGHESGCGQLTGDGSNNSHLQVPPTTTAPSWARASPPRPHATSRSSRAVAGQSRLPHVVDSTVRIPGTPSAPQPRRRGRGHGSPRRAAAGAGSRSPAQAGCPSYPAVNPPAIRVQVRPPRPEGWTRPGEDTLPPPTTTGSRRSAFVSRSRTNRDCGSAAISDANSGSTRSPHSSTSRRRRSAAQVDGGSSAASAVICAATRRNAACSRGSSRCACAGLRAGSAWPVHGDGLCVHRDDLQRLDAGATGTAVSVWCGRLLRTAPRMGGRRRYDARRSRGQRPSRPARCAAPHV